MESILEVKHLEKYYGNKGNLTKAIDDISFNVQEGEYLGVMGMSGSGKTTLLNCISTIEKVTSGKIIIKNKDITKIKSKNLCKFRREELGFIFQDFNLLDTLTSYENIALALTMSKNNYNDLEKRIDEVSTKLNIKNILSKYPSELSGGQKQKVSAARAIVTNPSLILADEPTGSLDSKSAKMLLESIDKLNKEMKATVLMVTHDAFTASYCDRILFIKDGKIFNEIVKGDDNKKEFFSRIIEVVTLLGGDNNNII